MGNIITEMQVCRIEYRSRHANISENPFFGGCAGKNKHLSVGERLILSWFVLTGIIHLVVEGEFNTTVPDTRPA